MNPPNKEMDEKKNSITIHIKDTEQTKQNKTMQHCHRKTKKNKNMEMDPQKHGIHSGGANTHRPLMETGLMAERRQRNKNGNAKPASTGNTQNGIGQNNEDNVQKIW